ncbi:MAG TPA: hypothetical protein VF518_04330 [Polyangia bacterium]
MSIQAAARSALACAFLLFPVGGLWLAGVAGCAPASADNRHGDGGRREIAADGVGAMPVPNRAVTVIGPAAETGPSQAECRPIVGLHREYDRLMLLARVCRADVDCKEILPVNGCSDCRVAVNRKSSHIGRLKELLGRMVKREDCNLHACTTYYNCGRFMRASCVRGQCETSSAELDPECGSPSRHGTRWP